MVYKYKCWFQDEKTFLAFDTIVDLVPAVFQADVFIDEPPLLEIPPSWGPEWEGYPIPKDPFTAYVWHDGHPKLHGGCSVGGRISVLVDLTEDLDVVVCRLWHELLHTCDMNSDNMFVDDWVPKSLRLRWKLDNMLGKAETPFWHKQYYYHLTKELLMNENNL